jgi:hypothetical protein
MEYVLYISQLCPDIRASGKCGIFESLRMHCPYREATVPQAELVKCFSVLRHY